MRFPDLRSAGYQITSPATPAYNCFAWAGNDTRSWRQPVELQGFYWPEGVPLEMTLENLTAVYGRLDYGPCQPDEIESGVEKLAIYVDADGLPTHAARQLSSGKWTSKLGELEDIAHATLECLESFYGKVSLILARRRA